MSQTTIEWTATRLPDGTVVPGYSFNPWWGCVRVSPGCVNCYAETFAKRVGQDVWGPESSRRYFGETHWNEPRKWNEKAKREGIRRRVFCSSMADVFERHPNFDENRNMRDERLKLWRLIEETPHLDWLLLTKRPENWSEMVPAYGSWSWLSEFPPNVWMLTTAEDQKRADERVPILLRIPAKVRGLSMEPLLGPVDLRGALGFDFTTPADDCRFEVPPVQWVIVGGESGPKARPCNVAHVRSIVQQCNAAGVPVFVKQLGARPVGCWGDWSELQPTCDTLDGGRFRLRNRKGNDPAEWPADLCVREFPEVRP